MISTLSSLSALLTGFALLCLGHGLNNTLIGMRAVEEHYSDWTLALMSSAYFAGFIIGARVCPSILSRVGHIRTIATFTSMASAVSIAYLLLLSEYAWIFYRFLYGICMAATYVSLESWLNALSSRSNRGRIMASYMIVNFCLAGSQWLILLGEPSGFRLFLLVSILISLSLIPTSISKRQGPQLGRSTDFSLNLLKGLNRTAVLGIAGVGLSLGSYWGLGASYMTKAGMSPDDVAKFLSVGFLGGLLFQWPIGLLSDRFDRRLTTAGTLLIAVLSSCIITLELQTNATGSSYLFGLAFLFGGSCYTLYSLFIALAHDYLEPHEVVAACAALIMLQAVGALFGPLLAMPLVLGFGPAGLFAFFAMIFSLMLGITLNEYRKSAPPPSATSSDFIALPRTGPGVATLERTGDADKMDQPGNPEAKSAV